MAAENLMVFGKGGISFWVAWNGRTGKNKKWFIYRLNKHNKRREKVEIGAAVVQELRDLTDSARMDRCRDLFMTRPRYEMSKGQEKRSYVYIARATK